MSEVAPDIASTDELPSRPVRLREAREAAGLHIAALAAALKVPVRKLEALEAGRYDELPDMTFARALASSACRQLKIDPAPVLAQLPQSQRPALVVDDHSLNAPFKSGSDAPPMSPLSWLSRPALLGAIAVLLGALVIVFLPKAEAPSQVAAPAAADAVAQTAAAPVTAPVAPLFQPGAEPAPVPGATSAGADPTAATAPTTTGGTSPAPAAPAAPAASAASAASAQAVVPAPASQTPATPVAAPAAVPPASTAPVAAAPSASAGAVVSLVASEESWAEVVNGTGTVVLQRLLQPGERVEFSAAPPYAVVLGNAAVVQVTLRGRAFDAAAIARNNVARFEAR
ncbi:MAG: helix-turn-helix domain-containing protein [Hydrogenophaga sp.]|nr:helix-turn-helix domain-containing protein [Hydrogenophaga sp.]